MTADGPPLYVAAGGGGDALGALMVALTEGGEPASIHVATFAWERKRFDPQIGPRAVSDFRNLLAPSAGVSEVGGESRLRRGRSFLPDLVRAAGCHVYLLDPTQGVRGLRAQLVALGDYLGSSDTFVIDVGGDILARGKEIGLRSPTADAMALAAADGTGASTWIVALGLGLDGELTRSQWREACRASARTQQIPEPARHLAPSAATFVRPLLTWHPSEVAGLACLAALGYRGTAEVRADGLQVTVDRDSASMHRFEHAWVMARNRVAQAIRDTTCLADVQVAVRETVGRTEFEDERRMLARRADYNTDWLSTAQLFAFESALLSYSDDAASREVSFLTLRRVSELLRLSPRPFGQLCAHLTARHPTRIRPPVWRCYAHEERHPDPIST
ncbi:MAG: DUF1152 domain-containing protein [Solirubrobacteraceae bacterium]